MILADKIIILRKRAGWSQEELAAQLHVTRQSVSKWEGAQSTPDLEKLVQMSRLFGVSADLLLKDELELPAPDAPADLPAPADTSTPPRRITLEDAEAYLALRAAAGPKMAVATFLMVLAPVPLLLLAGASDLTSAPISENAAAGLGLCILLLLAAAGVGLFLSSGSGSRAFAYLEDEAVEPAPGVNEFVEARRAAESASYTRRNTLGVLLCILSVLPLFGALCFENAEFLLVCAV